MGFWNENGILESDWYLFFFFLGGGWGRENVKFLLGLVFGLERGSIRVIWDFKGGSEMNTKQWRKRRDCKTGREEGLGLEGIGPDLGWAQFYYFFSAYG